MVTLIVMLTPEYFLRIFKSAFLEIIILKIM